MFVYLSICLSIYLSICLLFYISLTTTNLTVITILYTSADSLFIVFRLPAYTYIEVMRQTQCHKPTLNRGAWIWVWHWEWDPTRRRRSSTVRGCQWIYKYTYNDSNPHKLRCAGRPHNKSFTTFTSGFPSCTNIPIFFSPNTYPPISLNITISELTL